MTNLKRRISWSILSTILTTLAVLVPCSAVAEESPNWSINLGVFDLVDSDKATEAGIEYRFSTFQLWRQDLVPVAGLSATSEESLWAYGGLRWELGLGRWLVIPNLAFTLYEQGDGKDLGGVVQFRSGLEVAYRLANGDRVGLLFYHLSNARIYELNPGSEALVITWSW